MIISECPTCKQRVLLPDPPSKTPLERIKFEKDWDKRVTDARQRQ